MLSSLASLLGLCKHRGLALQLEAKRQSWHRLISKGTWNGRPIAAEASASHYQELLPLAYPVSPALAPALGRCPAGPGMRWHAPAYGALQAKKGSNIQSGRSGANSKAEGVYYLYRLYVRRDTGASHSWGTCTVDDTRRTAANSTPQ